MSAEEGSSNSSRGLAVAEPENALTDDTEEEEGGGGDNDEGWNEWVEDDSRLPAVQCLLSSGSAGSVEDALARDKEAFAFDLRQFLTTHGLDYVGFVRVVNFIRSSRAAGTEPGAIAAQLSDPQALAAVLSDDRHLHMVLQNDRLVYEGAEIVLPPDEDEEDENDSDGVAEDVGRAEGDSDDSNDSDDDALGMGGLDVGASIGKEQEQNVDTGLASAREAQLQKQLRRLAAENKQLVQELVETKAAVARFVAGTAAATATAAATGPAAGATKSGEEGEAAGGAAASRQRPPGSISARGRRDNDTYYFDSYSATAIHREMLSDSVRTSAYRDAILGNPSLFTGKVVLDVGCGTGILSLFAAKAGARRVIGVDMSTMTSTAQAVADRNGFGDVITIVRGKAEEVDLPLAPGEKVDIIISEWMGYALLYECMLQSVLVARDRFLAPGGTVLPNKTTIVLEVADERPGTGPLDFWDQVYGFDLSPVRQRVRVDVQEPLVNVLPASRVASSRCAVHTFDCVSMRADDVDVDWAPFSVTLSREPVGQGLAFVVLSFDTLFDADGGCTENAVEFRTDPASKTTHWVQTLLRLPEPVAGLHAGDVVSGQIQLRRNAVNPRELDIALRGFPQPDSILYYHMH